MVDKNYNHNIILFVIAFAILMLLSACSGRSTDENAPAKGESLSHEALELKYATQFSVDMYENGIKHIHIEDGYDYILLPQGMDEAEASRLGIDKAVVITESPESIYVAASSAMDLIRELGGLDRVKACSTNAEDYGIEEISKAINSGDIIYAGKYSAPDYELLMGLKTGLAVESTMIYHNPKVKEQLERLGIPVIVERSSYETDPLGRLEWIKLYGLLLGKYDEAFSFFDEQCARVDKLIENIDIKDKKEVAFFSVSPNGYVNVRKPKDYVSAMIEMAGGSYSFSSLKTEEDNALSTVKLNWEDFYKDAVDADILIYNSTIYGGYKKLDDLITPDSPLRDFKAVKEGHVWCTNMNLFQESSKIAVIIEDLYKVINDADADTASYLYKLE